MNCNIKTLRKQNNLTQRELAVLMDTNEALISRWEKGQQYPTVPNVFKLAQVLNCKVDDLYSI